MMIHGIGHGLKLAAGLAVLAIVGVVAAAPALAHGSETHAEPAAPTIGDAAVDVTLHDLELVDADGRPVKFASEAIGDRIVAIDFIYTSCTTVCPVVSTIFSLVQDQLGDRLGEDVLLVSISLDPTRDSPKRMTEHARKFGAGPGWLFLTGDKHAVEKVLTGLATYTPVYTDHPATVLIGDGKRGTWSRYFGFPNPDAIVARIEEYLAAREPSTTSLNLGATSLDPGE